jgi:rfaE bifunctional protein kinase chain/domain
MIDLQQLLDNRNKEYVVVVGDIMIDRYVWGTCNRISPEAPVPVVRVDSITHSPGGAGNVFKQLLDLGGKGILIGSVSDTDKEVVSSMFNSENSIIELSSTNGPTIIKERIMAHKRQMIRVDIEGGKVDEKEILSLLDKTFRMVPLGAIIIADYVKGVCSNKIAEYALYEARMRKIPIIVDTKDPDISKYGGATVLTPNENEWSKILDTSRHCLRSSTYIIITKSERGITVIDNDTGNSRDIPSCARHVFDVIGAGDVFVSTLALAMCCGYDIYSSAEIANVAAGVSVEKVGTSTVTVDEILAKANGKKKGDRTCQDGNQMQTS